VKFANKLYAAIALVGAGIAVGEQLYSRYMTYRQKYRRKKTPFGFHE
jgi:hypothetical protein